jgi:hypothetical protein
VARSRGRLASRLAAPELNHRPRSARSHIGPWAPPALIASALAGIYLVLAPISADLAAATYRSNLFARAGFLAWDNRWYGGHHLPGYSLLSPALGALLGPRLLLALAAIAAAALFAMIAASAFEGVAARLAAAWFAVAVGIQMLSGRVPFYLGLAIALGAVLAAIRRHTPAAIALAAISAVASPVTGAFLAIFGVATALSGARRRGVAIVAGGLVPVVALAVLFPEGGYEPFVAGSFWPALAATAAIAILLARERRRPLASGAALYAVAEILAFAVHTPLGGNVSRLGPLLGGPLVVAVLWQRRRTALFVVAPLLAYWSLIAPVSDFITADADRSAKASYYQPLLGELARVTGGRPVRIEIPPTAAHWEAVYVAPRVALARGWERQLDTRFDALFYRSKLSSGAYRAWLAQNAVSYVALPDAPLDYAAQSEGSLIRAGAAYLVPVWRSAHWRLFAVRDATPLAAAPATLTGLSTDGFTLRAPRAGRFEVRVRFTPYWALLAGHGCVAPAPGGWTRVTGTAAGSLRVGIRFALGRVLARGARCD